MWHGSINFHSADIFVREEKQMKFQIAITLSFIFFMTLSSLSAHVPYLEHRDYSEENPAEIRDSVENSKAFYSWFETGTDVDVYTFQFRRKADFYGEVLVPVCPEYENLLPWFALVGPGLPPIQVDVPFNVPPGYGGIVVENLEPGEPRDTFYEPFGGKSYYEGKETLELEISEPGVWYIYYWDPYEIGGDYVAVVGRREVFKPKDILRALIYTPMIRLDRELHVDCDNESVSPAPGMVNDDLTTTWGKIKERNK
jgi:hypothetical protein